MPPAAALRRKTFNVRLTAQATASELAQADQPEAEEPVYEGTIINSLDVTVEPVSSQWIEQLDLQPNFRGLVVRDVNPDGPAGGRLKGEDSGAPDIITAVENQPIRTEADLRSALRGVGTGGGASITDVVEAIEYSTDNGASVINISLGGPPMQIEEEACW